MRGLEAWCLAGSFDLKLTDITDGARIAFDNLSDYALSLGAPPVRLGVTGLARAGKTVFITALVHNLIHGGRLPVLAPWREGRLMGADLRPQLHQDVPTFDYRGHVRRLIDARAWPESTRAISEMRLSIAYESSTFWGRNVGRGRLDLDIVDYPGEWLLDLPLLSKDFRAFSREALERARDPRRAAIASDWLGYTNGLAADGLADEEAAGRAHELFSGYLSAARADEHALSMLPPGRFLMPGDLAGSPALTFAPLDLPDGGRPGEGSLWQMMESRYEAYKDVVVRPFFRNHFARLDRQVVLVDVLNALNGGRAALLDLEAALQEILTCFRPGKSSWLSQVLTRRVDRILFAATKADQLNHVSHDRLERILRRLLDGAIAKASFSGAEVEVRAIAAVRATREANVKRNGDTLPCIMGVPQAGEQLDGRIFAGNEEIALFPGDLPESPQGLFADPAAGLAPETSLISEMRFLRFRPPPLEVTAEGLQLSLPHIRLDRALDFLIGDRLA
ncbi:YcjX family protein [Oryzibacter oryziterrae]|uniref:YcjX family protein n=1 Tax=Oryzibacter oryziterrae TaxID=2766474 RepID=UPI001F2686F2|nr:YcjX family protein [Oryzibacter oryziterrae]